MQTTFSRLSGESKDTDSAQTGHGTIIASCAAGQRYGVAKEATLISAKSTYKSTDAVQSIIDLCDHIKASGRVKKSVVVMSWGITSLGYTLDAYDDIAADLEDAMYSCLEAGVPFVLAAGNNATPGRTSFNSIPQTMNNDKFPLIIVGNSDKNGNRWHNSQDGRGLTLYAPGVGVKGLNKYGSEQEVTGTSACTFTRHYK